MISKPLVLGRYFRNCGPPGDWTFAASSGPLFCSTIFRLSAIALSRFSSPMSMTSSSVGSVMTPGRKYSSVFALSPRSRRPIEKRPSSRAGSDSLGTMPDTKIVQSFRLPFVFWTLMYFASRLVSTLRILPSEPDLYDSRKLSTDLAGTSCQIGR